MCSPAGWALLDDSTQAAGRTKNTFLCADRIQFVQTATGTAKVGEELDRPDVKAGREQEAVLGTGIAKVGQACDALDFKDGSRQ